MTNTSLELFCDRVLDAGRITRDDVRLLSGEILADGFMNRDEADMLLALDRAVPEQDATFAGVLAAAVVDFAVWGERPTGMIDRATAAWLAASLGGRKGPTATGTRIAIEVVREAQTTDETLIAFALAANRWSRDPAAPRPSPLALAA